MSALMPTGGSSDASETGWESRGAASRRRDGSRAGAGPQTHVRYSVTHGAGPGPARTANGNAAALERVPRDASCRVRKSPPRRIFTPQRIFLSPCIAIPQCFHRLAEASIVLDVPSKCRPLRAVSRPRTGLSLFVSSSSIKNTGNIRSTRSESQSVLQRSRFSPWGRSRPATRQRPCRLG